MAVEGIVLRSQKGQRQMARHVLEADDKTLFVVQGSQGGAVAGEDDRGLRLPVFRNAADVGQIARCPVKEHGRRAAGQHAPGKKDRQ